MLQNRRGFLSTLGGAAAGLAVRPGALGALVWPERRTRLDKVGIQLYTLRRVAQTDLPGTLAQLGKIGYKEIEFAGYYNRPPTEVRDILKANGLTAPSTHVGVNVIEQTPDKLFEESRIVGHEWITVPSLPSGPKATVDDWKRIADQFNRAAAHVKEAGFRFAFHNHNAEFKKIGDAVPLEILIKETDPALVSYEMDIYWVVNGGGNPLDLIARYPGRFKMLHVKDSAGPPDHKMVEVGAGTIDFKTIFAKAKGIEHYFVEHDQPADPIASATASFNYLNSLSF
ncbi:MAG TPA: sugar phosphate isomerase/epimerase [Gemmatimonadaceae bacterium]